MPNDPPNSWRMFLPLGVVLLLALAWSGYWLVASGVARERFAEERSRLSREETKLSCTDERWGGFPFHFEFSCNSPVLTRKGTAELRSGSLRLAALAYAPRQIVALLDGPTTVSARGLLPTEIIHQRIIAALTFDENGKPSLSAEIPALSVPGIGEAARLMLHSRPSTSGGTDIAASVTALNYQQAGRPALLIEQADVRGTLTPEHTLTVEHAELRQGAVRYWGSGTLHLDAAHRPAGKLDTQTNDLDAMLKVLGPHIDLDASETSGLRTVLGLLGNEAKAPLIAKDGILYLGPFRLTELAPLY